MFDVVAIISTLTIMDTTTRESEGGVSGRPRQACSKNMWAFWHSSYGENNGLLHG